jgi:hypothetical protein
MSQAQAGISVTCGSCGTRLRVRPEAEGKIGKCPKCGVRFQITLPKPPPPKPQPAAPQPQAQQQAVAPPPALAQPPTPALAPAPQFAEAAIPVAPPTPFEQPIAHRAQPAPAPTGGGLSASSLRASITDAISDDDWKRGMSPEVLLEIEAENARMARQGSISVAVLVFASIVAGAAVCFEVARYGGHEHWVIKRAVAAWLIGMMSAGAMLASSGRRGGALRFLAAITAAGAIVVGKLFTDVTAPYAPIEALFAVLAIAGSTFTFLLAEPSKSKPTAAEALATAPTT